MPTTVTHTVIADLFPEVVVPPTTLRETAACRRIHRVGQVGQPNLPIDKDSQGLAVAPTSLGKNQEEKNLLAT